MLDKFLRHKLYFYGGVGALFSHPLPLREKVLGFSIHCCQLTVFPWFIFVKSVLDFQIPLYPQTLRFVYVRTEVKDTRMAQPQ